ncbi:MAG: dTDP-4-dehydrorhamnose reductase [Candidatus Saganbacteria bacterium]|nr:dTDP-4-dehydrorhamnose reductase [Candidatus Saganbacteria bacterium]
MILVTGANGMVGSYVKEVFCDEELILTDLPELDISKRASLEGKLNKYRPEYVLHLAAETNVDKCETEIEHAYKINVEGTKNVAEACKRLGSTLIYISTGYVFNGKGRQLHSENDRADPQNVYGRTKLEGEKIVREILEKYYIFRADWMIGGGPQRDKKYVGQIIRKCEQNSDIEAIEDQYSTPTFAGDFLAGIKLVTKTQPCGLYHLANKGICSRYEMAVEIARQLGTKNKVIPVPSSVFKAPAKRAQSTALRNFKLEQLGLDIMPGWKISLEKYLNEWRHEQSFYAK